MGGIVYAEAGSIIDGPALRYIRTPSLQKSDSIAIKFQNQE